MALPKGTLERLSEVPLFALCTQKDLRLVAKRLERVHTKAGETVVAQGERGDQFFIIAEGAARVVRNGRKIADLGPGSFFGELALLDPSLRNASVVAATDLELLALTQPYFTEVVHSSPGFASKLLAALARRLRDTDAKSFG